MMEDGVGDVRESFPGGQGPAAHGADTVGV